MDFAAKQTLVFSVIGGLGIFLYGMKIMSEGMQAVAGDKLRGLLNSITSNRLKACGVGMAVTGLIQSSSVTTVMVVGMVNAGLLSLQQAIGVILGADIGTTVTAWIVSLPITKWGLPMLGMSVFFYLFSKSERTRYVSLMLLGLGMVFYGLQLMKDGVEPLRETAFIRDVLSEFRPTNYIGVMKCVLAGTLVTAIVQSSSATVAITITMATSGLITYETAVALVLGENIGTTVTAYLASLALARNAKRAAYAHILVKIAGVCWIFPLFFLYLRFLEFGFSSTLSLSSWLTIPSLSIIEIPLGIRIAMAHTCFNVVNVSLFLLLLPYIAKVLLRLVPDKGPKEDVYLTFLDVRMLDTPALGIDQSQKEVQRMGEYVGVMMADLRACLVSKGPCNKCEEQIFHHEETLDLLQKEVVDFLMKLLANDVPSSVMLRGRSQLRMADEYESVSDYIRNILKLHLKMRKAGEVMSDDSMENLLSLHDDVEAYVARINKAVYQYETRILPTAKTKGDAITYLMKECRSKHLSRVEHGQSSTIKNLIITDMLNAYRRIKDHAFNIAEAVAGEK